MVLCAVLAQAQGAPDFSKVEIKANRVTDKFYTLDGQGTIGVLFRRRRLPGGHAVRAAERQDRRRDQTLTPQPIKFVVNTHVHGDHTGGDENFGKLGATIISREELRYRLAIPIRTRTERPAWRWPRRPAEADPIATC
jgi:glyoxylase-like metal-dependent hydrolase (beta-lactamase superfamily II)